MQSGHHVREPVVVTGVVLGRGGGVAWEFRAAVAVEVPPSPSQVDAIVGHGVDVVMRERERIREERRNPRVRAESALRGHVVHEVVVDGDLGANAFNPFCELLVGASVPQIDVLRVTDRDAAAGNVGDEIADDVGVDDVVDH